MNIDPNTKEMLVRYAECFVKGGPGLVPNNKPKGQMQLIQKDWFNDASIIELAMDDGSARRFRDYRVVPVERIKKNPACTFFFT